MNPITFGPVYALSSTGKVKIWEARVDDFDACANLTTTHGYDGGTCSLNIRVIEGKNTGKKNSTTPFEQACADAESKLRKKRDEGYVDDKSELTNQELLLPMLAHRYDVRKKDILWPCYVQPKLNGVRCIGTGDRFISRKGKDYTTLDHLQSAVNSLVQEVGYPLDGEIFHPEWGFQEIIRALKKDCGEVTDKLQYWIYDVVAPDKTFEERRELFLNMSYFPGIVKVPTNGVRSEAEMFAKHKEFTSAGFEGTIIRNIKGKYLLKNRSKDLQKYKDFVDDEFKIVDGVEAQGNDIGTVIFVCETKDGKKFNVRPKGSREVRREWLRDIDKIKNSMLTIRYQEESEDGIPIFPVGLGFEAIRDYE